MRRIDLSSYDYEAKGQSVCKACNGTGLVPEVLPTPYNVRANLIEALYSPELKLSARQVLDQEDLARKIRDCPDGFILLEEEEYNRALQAINSARGFGKADVEFVRRIVDAEKVILQAGSV